MLTEDWCQHFCKGGWLMANGGGIMNGNFKSKVGKKQNFTINSVEFNSGELNMGLTFTNKALQIMTPIYMLMKITPPLKSNIPQGFWTLKELKRRGAMKKEWNQQYSPKPVTLRFWTFPFTIWPWKDMVTHSKLEEEEFQRRGNLCTKDVPRWFVKNKCGLSKGQHFEKVKRENF